MTKKQFLGLLLIAGGTVQSYLSYRKIYAEENVKRDEIAANLATDLEAIKRASLKMEQKMKNPDYRPTGVKQVFDDLEFEIIAAHYE